MLTIPQLLDYFETLAPGLRARVAGAPAALILELEQAAERRLPDVQREFLSLMGEDLGGICEGFVGADMRAATLLDHFRTSGWIPPAPFVLVGIDDQGAPMDSFLRCAPELAEPEFVQFTIPGGQQALIPSGPDNYRLMAPSLPAFLYRCGFTNFVGLRFALSNTAEVLEAHAEHGAAFDARLIQLGLRREPGTDVLTGAYQAQEAAVLWSRNNLEDPVFVAMYADTPELLDELAAKLASVAPMRRYAIMPARDE